MARDSLRLLRLTSLALAFAWGVIGFALGVSAVVKSNHQKSEIRHAAPAAASISISTADILGAGGALTGACGLLFVESLLFLLSSFLPVPLLGSLPLQSHLLAFTTVFIFAAAVPTSDFVARRQAKVHASLGGVELPPSVIQSVQNQLGVTGVYKHIHYLRLIAIIPWIAFLFALTSTVLSYRAARRAPATAATAPPSLEEDEKKRPEKADASAV
ncbi:hypothetical protein NEOLEDRAFT_1147578 [Neolentinus lepideus HHB14362 ss-1]|uniref:Uncharacterized protein n=1 Tax=Neolentinus lepideus HHB14362 ss-1 TaxID=1314782 RepID=A0A165SXB1_9AGAM|nr:hypothetical protein NEOLEDRAFT_1147578 [Neolentinus lepideus HHB14362 ss-1]